MSDFEMAARMNPARINLSGWRSDGYDFLQFKKRSE